jgi:hypothetical protein
MLSIVYRYTLEILLICLKLGDHFYILFILLLLLALSKSKYLGSDAELHPELNPELLESQVSGSESKLQGKMGSGSEKIVGSTNDGLLLPALSCRRRCNK